MRPAACIALGFALGMVCMLALPVVAALAIGGVLVASVVLGTAVAHRPRRSLESWPPPVITEVRENARRARTVPPTPPINMPHRQRVGEAGE